MIERDTLADLRAWRDEFARAHGYDLAAMVTTLRAMKLLSGEKLVRGSPRQPTLTVKSSEVTIIPSEPSR